MIGFVQKNSLFDIGLVTESQTFEGLYQSMLDVIKDKLVRPVLMLKYVMNDTVTEHYLNLQGVTPTALNFTNGIVSVSVNAANTVTVSEVVEAIAEIAEEVAPVKDVKVDGTSVVDSDDVANVTIPVKDVKVDGTSVVDENGDAIIAIPNKVVFVTFTLNEQTDEMTSSLTFEQIVSAINNEFVVIGNYNNYLYYACSIETIGNDTSIQFTGAFAQRLADGNVANQTFDDIFIHEDNTIDWGYGVPTEKAIGISIDPVTNDYIILYPTFANYNEFSIFATADYIIYDTITGEAYVCTERVANHMTFINLAVTNPQSGTIQMNVITISRGTNNAIEISKQSFNVGGGGSSETWTTLWENSSPSSPSTGRTLDSLVAIPATTRKFRTTFRIINDTDRTCESIVIFPDDYVLSSNSLYYMIGENHYRRVTIKATGVLSTSKVIFSQCYEVNSTTAQNAYTIPIKFEAVIPT